MQRCGSAVKRGPYIRHFKKLSAIAVLLVGMRGMQVSYVSADGNNISCNVLRDCGSLIRHRQFFFNSAAPVRFLIELNIFANHACCMK